ncbi:MAG: helix-turn-helix domain-containing protein [Oscillospiraceae bacterium]|jgi:AraC-like DNA-binding protein/predicted transcriptional regulator YdeE|nr:helix-turn-helix domain-containing protein [Oscillospiraceae bacterium]
MPINPLLTELEANITNALSVERLADAGLLSRSQAYREFYSATGHSIKEYIRKRRLSKALSLIRHTQLPLKQIAHKCGFSSDQVLCRSVKAAIGQTPAQYKIGGDEYFFPACDDPPTQAVAVTSETLPPTRCLRYYDSRLLGIEDRAIAWLFAQRPGYRGRIFGRNGQQKGAKLCYELYIEDDGADCAEITGTFAKTICPNAEDAINAAWDYLYNDWLKTSMFVQGDVPYLEEYLCADGRARRLVLYLHVQKKQGFHKIQRCPCDELRFLVARRFGADAEKAAAQTVMDFLAARHPALAQNARQFYVATGQDHAYTCGVALPPSLPLPPDSAVEILTHPAGEYAVLEGDCCGDAGAYETVLSAWIKSMGLRAVDTPFEVYEANGGFERRDIRVKIYQKVEK